MYREREKIPPVPHPSAEAEHLTKSEGATQNPRDFGRQSKKHVCGNHAHRLPTSPAANEFRNHVTFNYTNVTNSYEVKITNSLVRAGKLYSAKQQVPDTPAAPDAVPLGLGRYRPTTPARQGPAHARNGGSRPTTTTPLATRRKFPKN